MGGKKGKQVPYTLLGSVTVTARSKSFQPSSVEHDQSNFSSPSQMSTGVFTICPWSGNFMDVCGEVAEGSWINPQPNGPQWLSKCQELL